MSLETPPPCPLSLLPPPPAAPQHAAHGGSAGLEASVTRNRPARQRLPPPPAAARRRPPPPHLPVHAVLEAVLGGGVAPDGQLQDGAWKRAGRALGRGRRARAAAARPSGRRRGRSAARHGAPCWSPPVSPEPFDFVSPAAARCCRGFWGRSHGRGAAAVATRAGRTR